MKLVSPKGLFLTRIMESGVNMEHPSGLIKASSRLSLLLSMYV